MTGVVFAPMLRLDKLLRENELPAVLSECDGLEGYEFVDRVLDYFNLSYSAVGREVERIPSEGGVLMLAHRPLGVVDCAALLKLVREVRRDVRVVANDALNAFAPLRALLLPREAMRAALDNGEALIAGGALGFDQHPKALLLPVHVRRFYGLSALFRRAATLPIRIAPAIGWKDAQATRKGKLLGFKTASPIARPEDRLELRRELQNARVLGQTGDGKQIFLFEARADSAVVRELGRLREIAFRQVGEGTGKRRDVDAFDAYYRHVVLWDDAELQIAGAYRVGEAAKILEEHGPDGLYTHRLFSYGAGLRACLPEALELGRSFVQPRYQGLRALDCLWQGIGAYVVTQPRMRYLFGPVSLSASYPAAARRMLVYFFARHHGADETLATGRLPFVIEQIELAALERLFPGEDYQRDLRALKQQLAAMEVAIPVLFRQYAELCEPGGTRFLAFNVDPAFANCIDGLVLVDLQRVKAAKRERYLSAGHDLRQPAQGMLKSA